MRKYLPLSGLLLLVLLAGGLLGLMARAPVKALQTEPKVRADSPHATAAGKLSDTKKMLSLPVRGYRGASCVLSGTWKANVDFWVSCDEEQTWQRAMVYWEQKDGRTVDSAGSLQNGTYRWLDLGGVTHVGVQLGTYESGSVEVLLRTTAVPATTPMTVARDGVMGPQTPIMLIVGGPDTGGQVAHAVRVTTAPVAPSDYGLNVRLVPNNYHHINSNDTTTIKKGPGVLHAVSINSAGSGWTIAVYDSTGAGGAVLAVIKPTAAGTLLYDVPFATGCTLETSGAVAGDITISYQ